MTKYVPDIKNDCIRETISYNFSNRQPSSSKQNIISNQTRSKTRRVHGTKHQETKIFTHGPNDRKRTENIQKQFTAKFLKVR